MPQLALIAPRCTRTGACPFPAMVSLSPPDERTGSTDRQVLETLWLMKAIAHDAVPDVPRYGTPPEIYDFVRQHMKFRADPAHAEKLIHPGQLAQDIERDGIGFGDCDDRAMLQAAMLLKIGSPCAFVVMGRDRLGNFQHVICAAGRARGPDNLNGLTPMDSQERMPMGKWTPPVPDDGRFFVLPV